MTLSLRTDFSKITTLKETPQGGVRVPGRLTRIGIFEYKRADGSIQRELRRPEQVFHPDSLESLQSAPVTDLHPSQMVSAETYRALNRGQIADSSVKRDGKFVAGELVVQDGELVGKIKRKDHKEISCGYACVVVQNPGKVAGIPGMEEWEGQHYDAEQTEIRYNHVATGPEGWGRAGSEVSMKLDSNGNQVIEQQATPPAPKKPLRRFDMKHLPLVALTFATDFRSCRVDSVEFRLDDKEGRKQAMAALSGGLQRARETASRLDMDAEKAKMLVDEVMATFAQLQTQFMALAVACTDASLETEEMALEPAAPEDVPEDVLDAFIAKRVAILDRARKMAPNAKFDGLRERAIMETALKDRKVEVKADHSDEFVRGMFETQPITASQAKPSNASQLSGVQAHLDGGNTEGTLDADQVRADSLEKSRNAWKTPLNKN